MNHIVEIRNFSRMIFKYIHRYVLKFHQFDQCVINLYLSSSTRLQKNPVPLFFTFVDVHTAFLLSRFVPKLESAKAKIKVEKLHFFRCVVEIT